MVVYVNFRISICMFTAIFGLKNAVHIYLSEILGAGRVHYDGLVLIMGHKIIFWDKQYI